MILVKLYRTLLTQFDPIGLKRYEIQEKDLEIVEHYLAIIQMNRLGLFNSVIKLAI